MMPQNQLHQKKVFAICKSKFRTHLKFNKFPYKETAILINLYFVS